MRTSLLGCRRSRIADHGSQTRRNQMLKPQRFIAPAALVFLCTVGLATANAANISASETITDVAILVGTQFDVIPFTSTSSGESVDGTGVFLASVTATGMALVVLTEGLGGPNSDWLQLIYSGTPGGPETVTVHWRSDSDPGGLPALPTGVVPQFLVETGGLQEVTAQLAASAAASGF